jgi:ATP-binding cassette subfamily B protein
LTLEDTRWLCVPVGLQSALVLQGTIPALLIWVTKSIIDFVTSAVTTGEVATADFLPAVLLWVSALLLESSLTPWIAAAQGNLNEKLTAHVNLVLMRKADSLPDLSRFETAGFHDELQVLRDQAAYQPVNLIVYLANGLRELVIVLSVLVLLSTVAVWVPLLILLTSLPHAIVLFQLQRNSWETMVWKSPQARRMQYFSSLLLSDTHARESRLFGYGPWLIERYRSAFNDTHQAMRQVRSRQALWSNLLVAFSALGNGFVFYQVVRRAAQGLIGPGSILLLVQSLLYVQQNLLLLTQDMTMLQDTWRYFGKLFEFLDSESPLSTAEATKPVPALGGAGVHLDDVSFSYPDGRLALERVSLQLEPGRITALVGENGAGKTTIAKLLARFYDPTQGRILIEGTDLREVDLRAWRDSLGVIFQDYGRYQLTLEENILLGPDTLDARTGEGRELLERSGVHELIKVLPEGLKGMLGKQFGGTELSGGEWQKVALARALARQEQAQLLILDEPTAALDPRSESELYREFARLAKGVTTLLITHRLGSVRMADRILVLKNGRIVESGTHQQLLVLNGEYAELWRMQADSYQPGAAT